MHRPLVRRLPVACNLFAIAIGRSASFLELAASEEHPRWHVVREGASKRNPPLPLLAHVLWLGQDGRPAPPPLPADALAVTITPSVACPNTRLTPGVEVSDRYPALPCAPRSEKHELQGALVDLVHQAGDFGQVRTATPGMASPGMSDSGCSNGLSRNGWNADRPWRRTR